MTNEEARRVLERMGSRVNADGSLFFAGRYGGVADVNAAFMGEVEYNADQLEAIAMWMRDPKGVMGEG